MGMEGQEKLLNSKVLVMGLGGLGCAASPYLVAAGIGEMTLVDFDRVEVSNLQRQILHTDNDLNRNKVDSAKESLQPLNPSCKIQTIHAQLDQQALSDLVQQHTLVLDCTDNLVTRKQINQCCFQHKTPLVSGAAIRMEGQVSTFTMKENTPCYECFSQQMGEQQLSCVESGVLGPIVGMVGSTQAMEAIKLISGFGTPLQGKLLLIDGKTMDFRSFSFAKNPQCKTCGAS